MAEVAFLFVFATHSFAFSPLRHLLFAICKTAAADNSIDLDALRLSGQLYTQPVLWVRLPDAARDGALPKLVGLTSAERVVLEELVHDECREMLPSLASSSQTAQ